MNSTSGKSGRKRKATTDKSGAALLRRLVKSLEKWRCEPSNYPVVASLNSEVKVIFESHHTMLHLMKQVGGMANILEARGHGRSMVKADKQVAAQLFGKLILNAVRLATLLEMSPEELHQGILDAEAALH